MIVQNGLVAIKRIPVRGKLINVNGNEYLFQIQHNISLCWVRQEDMYKVLDIKQGCCGGQKKPVFHFALEHDVRRWENGGR
jgi:hypothetical protein